MSKHEMLYIALAVIAVVAVVALAMWATNRRRTARLQGTFGPEYDRVVHASGDRRLAERELTGRAERRRGLEIVPLAAASRDRYLQQWQAVQVAFVDSPVMSVRQADHLVGQVMTERGYPMHDFERRAADISVDHPDVVENYRAAHAVSLASEANQATTEQLRQAMTNFRSLFERLLGGAEQGAGDPALSPSGSSSSVNALR